jgi:hypothetical protein
MVLSMRALEDGDDELLHNMDTSRDRSNNVLMLIL